MKPLYIVLAFILLVNVHGYSQDAHGQFTSLLRDYVQDGKVNYRQLCKDDRLEAYLAQLAVTNPDTISEEKAKLAFWINAYNAYTLKVICDHYPIRSINELHTGGLIIGTVLKKTIWDKPLVTVNGKITTLNTIEHKIIRQKFRDPRIHFALVCAAQSCPPLRSEAYEGSKLDAQLDDQGRKFFSTLSKNYFEIDKMQAHLSKILDWYSKDFGNSEEEILLYITRFLPDDLAAAIKGDPKKWKIKHTKYDWSLNE
ncbi:MAG: DUF547 domain-containing protein [bacterium]